MKHAAMAMEQGSLQAQISKLKDQNQKLKDAEEKAIKELTKLQVKQSISRVKF